MPRLRPRSRAARLLAGLLGRALVLLVPAAPAKPLAELAEEAVVAPPKVESTKDFVDLYIVNGNAIGNAVGAVAGQMAFTALFGPAGWIAGSLIGGFSGGLIGEWADNQVHGAYNYAAFNRPAFGEPGSIVLQDAGTWEQTFYQLDSRVINGGGVATMVTHFSINALVGSIPGVGPAVRPIALAIADYAAGVLGDIADGMIDLSQVGKRLDEEKAKARGEDPESAAASRPESGEAEVGPAAAGDGDPRALYRAALRALEADAGGGAEARERLEAYRQRRGPEAAGP